MVEWFILVKNVVLQKNSVILVFYVEVCVKKRNRDKQKILNFSKIFSSEDVFSITTWSESENEYAQMLMMPHRTPVNTCFRDHSTLFLRSRT